MHSSTELIFILAFIASLVGASVTTLYRFIIASANDRRAERLRRLEAISRYLDVGEAVERTGVQIDTDTPITSASGDLVDRSPFVDAIARLLSAVGSDAGFAIGITGGWGTGKTSALNLISERLRDGGERYIVLRVEPWSANRRSDLTADVYQRIGVMLMAAYVRTREAAKPDKALLTLAGGFMSLAMYFLDSEPRAALMRFCDGIDLPTIARTGVAIYEVFDEIAATLRQRQYKLVICVDDVDRLSSHEILDFMRLVTTLRDIPRTIIIAAINLDQLHRAFGQEAVENEYSEKVFQALVPLPATPPYLLQGMWLEKVNQISDGILSTAFRDGHLQKLVIHASSLIRTLREVRRVQNTFAYFWKILANKVDIADVLALSALATVRPQIFGDFAAYRVILVGEASPMAFSTPSRDETERVINAITEGVDLPDQPSVRGILLELFPFAATNLERSMSSSGRASYPRSEWRVARRIADARLFELALSQSAVEPGGFLPAEIWPIIRSAEDAGQMEQSIRSLIRAGRGTQLLTALQAEIFEVDEASVAPLASALLALATQFYDERRDILVNNRLRLTWLLNELFSQLHQDLRFDILRKVVMNGDDAYLFVAVYLSIQLDARERQPSVPLILTEEFTVRLRDDIVDRLQKDVVSGDIFRRQYLRAEGLLGFAILRYIAWRGETGRIEIVRSLDSDAAFAEYLTTFVGYGSLYQEDLAKLDVAIFGSVAAFSSRVDAFLASRYWRSLTDDDRSRFERVLETMLSRPDLPGE